MVGLQCKCWVHGTSNMLVGVQTQDLAEPKERMLSGADPTTSIAIDGERALGSQSVAVTSDQKHICRRPGLGGFRTAIFFEEERCDSSATHKD